LMQKHLLAPSPRGIGQVFGAALLDLVAEVDAVILGVPSKKSAAPRKGPCVKVRKKIHARSLAHNSNFTSLFHTCFLHTHISSYASMGTHKKEKNRKEREGKSGDGMGNVSFFFFCNHL
jgi:hypothetical protein